MTRQAIADQYAKPVRDELGNIQTVFLKVNGKTQRCPCGSNCFHYPDDKHLYLMECNGCGHRYHTTRMADTTEKELA